MSESDEAQDERVVRFVIVDSVIRKRPARDVV